MINFDNLHTQIPAFGAERDEANSDEARLYFEYYGIDFESRFDGLKHNFGHLPCDRFDIVLHHFELPQAEGTCFIVHGYFDHTGLYNHLIDYLLKRNQSVIIYDLPGHGLSTGERATIGSFAEYQTVLQHIVLHFKERAVQPWSAIGQSTGGAILMDFLLNDGAPFFRKAVLLAPLVRPRRWSLASAAHSLLKLLVTQTPRRFVANSNDRAFNNFLKHHDPLQHRYLPVQWVTALKQWIKYFTTLPPNPDVKPLVVQGKQDTTVDWQWNIPLIEEKFDKPKVFYLQDACHHLVKEDNNNREKLFAALDLYFDQ